MSIINAYSLEAGNKSCVVTVHEENDEEGVSVVYDKLWNALTDGHFVEYFDPYELLNFIKETVYWKKKGKRLNINLVSNISSPKSTNVS